MKRTLVLTVLILGGTVITVMFAFSLACDKFKKWLDDRGIL